MVGVTATAKRLHPGQMPTTNEIVSKMWEWLDGHPQEKFRRQNFHPIEDFTYPVSKLWDGYHELMNNGAAAFGRFADANRMPKNDRDRVTMKVQIVKQGRGGDFVNELNKLTGQAGRAAE